MHVLVSLSQTLTLSFFPIGPWSMQMYAQYSRQKLREMQAPLQQQTLGTSHAQNHQRMRTL